VKKSCQGRTIKMGETRASKRGKKEWYQVGGEKEKVDVVREEKEKEEPLHKRVPGN